MTDTELINELHTLHAAVVVPDIDEVAFRAKVRASRRNRRIGRGLGVAAAAAALVAGVAVVNQVWPDGRDAETPVASGSSDAGLPVAFTQGRDVRVLLADGSVVSTGVQAEEVLGMAGDSVVVVSGDSEVLAVPVGEAGRSVVTSALSDGPAERAELSADGATLGWVDLGGTLHVQDIESGNALFTGALGGQRLLDVDATHWVVSDGKQVSVRSIAPGTGPDVEVTAAADVMSAQLRGETLAVSTREGIEFFESGRPAQQSPVGGSLGALSPDGTSFVSAPDEDEIDTGAAPRLDFFDPRTAAHTATLSQVDFSAVTGIEWAGNRVVVSAWGDRGQALYECSATQLSCEQVADGADVKLPTN